MNHKNYLYDINAKLEACAGRTEKEVNTIIKEQTPKKPLRTEDVLN